MSIHSIEPGLLLAAPRLGEPNLGGTVVLLGAHEEGGSIGWTLNGDKLAAGPEIVRATGLVAAGAALPPVFERAALSGGPVSPESVWIVYRRSSGDDLLPGSLPVGEEIAVTSSLDALRMLIDGGGPSEVRLLIGYAGWGPGQLDREVSKGVWLPAAADADLVFDASTATLWQRAYAGAIGTIPAAFVGKTRGSA
ncbi:MAG: YqgE/AlgH family protein [Polyangiales bacterium]